MLLFIDGFDAYGVSGPPSPTGVITRKYAISTLPDEYSTIVAGRISGYAYRIGGYSGNYMKARDLTTDATMIVGGAFFFNSFANGFGYYSFMKFVRWWYVRGQSLAHKRWPVGSLLWGILAWDNFCIWYRDQCLVLY